MKDFLINNREKFMDSIKDGELALFFNGSAPNSTADSHYPFRTNKNFYYFTGIKQEGFVLAMGRSNGKSETILFIKKPNYDIEKWIGRFLTKDMCIETTGIDSIQFVEDFNEWVNRTLGKEQYDTVLLDLFRVSYDVTLSDAYAFSKVLKDRYPYVNIKNSDSMMRKLRLIKSDFEVEQIREAIKLTGAGLKRVLDTLEPGQKEYQAVAEFDYGIMHGGADREAFETIAASGDNAVILHYVSNRDVINDGELVLFDLGAQVNEYSADITRTYPANGKFSDRQKELYNIVLKTNMEIIDMIKPGVTMPELNKRAIEILTSEMKRIGLIEKDDEYSKYYYHSIGHPLGLDTHDLGARDLTIEEGMILTVEPGLYNAQEGIGIRIEDDVLVTKEGYEVLSSDIIKSVEDIEAAMKGIK